MKFVALLLLPIAASSGSSASARHEGPQDQVQVTRAVGQPIGARSLRGRQKRRPCAKSIATYCAGAKNAAAKQACLRSKLFGNLLDPRCEALVERRADALNACRSVAAAVGCAQGPVPIACMQRRYRKAGADTLLAGTACAVALDRLAGHKAASQASNRAADERQARIAAILKAMPPAEAGGIRGEHARLVAAAHLADQEARATTDYLAKRYPSSTLPDGTHVKATRVGHGSGGARRSPFASPGQGLGSSPWADSLFSSSPELAQQLQRTMPRAASSSPWDPAEVRSWSDPAYRKHRRHHKNALQMVGV